MLNLVLEYTTIAATLLLLVVGIVCTIVLNLIQVRAVKRFYQLLAIGIPQISLHAHATQTVNPFYALFTAMSTSLGIGTIVGPSIAIVIGGPGSLFWIISYGFFGAVIKYLEVTFGILFRATTADKQILGGPMQYLKQVHRYLAHWYTGITVILFTSWSMIQSNVLAQTLHQIHIPTWMTGAGLAGLICYMLIGGAARIGKFNSQLVPIMSGVYIILCSYIILTHPDQLLHALDEMVHTAFSPAPIIGGVAATSCIRTMCAGVTRGAFITESGIGTASIAHSLSPAAYPTDQAVLAMISVSADIFLATLSGLLIIMSGVWQARVISNVMMYQVFTHYYPTIGQPILIACIVMFVLGTIIGNSFNGKQSFAALTGYRYMFFYTLYASSMIFLGALIDVPLMWRISDALLPFVVIPHTIGLMYLFKKYKSKTDIVQ